MAALPASDVIENCFDERALLELIGILKDRRRGTAYNAFRLPPRGQRPGTPQLRALELASNRLAYLRPKMPHKYMKTGTELLTDLFAAVPDPADELVKAGKGRIGGAIAVGATGPIAAPLEWLAAYGIPIVQVQDCDMPNGWAGFFQHHPPSVKIPMTARQSPEDMWVVWHELGHAADYVTSREGTIIPTPHGQFSTRHIELMRQHQETIILWSPHPNRDYKTSPHELWAEVVACAICAPHKMPVPLLDGVRPDLERLRLPVGKPPILAALASESLSDAEDLSGLFDEQPPTT